MPSFEQMLLILAFIIVLMPFAHALVRFRFNRRLQRESHQRLCAQCLREVNERHGAIPEGTVLSVLKDNDALKKQNASLQAKLDRLMLEFCPDEMDPEQLKKWAQHQVAVTGLDAELENRTRLQFDDPLGRAIQQAHEDRKGDAS